MRRGWLAALAALFIAMAATAQDAFRIVYFDDFAPLSWKDETGQMRGILVDAATEAIQVRSGIPVIHEGYPWERAQAMVRTGAADALVTLPTPERKAYAEIGEAAIFRDRMKVFTREDNPRLAELQAVKTVAQLRGFRIANNIGNGWVKANLIDKGIPIEVTVPTFAQGLQMLDSDRVDALINLTSILRYIRRNLTLSHRIIELPNALDTVEWRLIVSRQSKYVHMLPAFDRAVTRMQKDGTIARIAQAYE